MVNLFDARQETRPFTKYLKEAGIYSTSFGEFGEFVFRRKLVSYFSDPYKEWFDDILDRIPLNSDLGKGLNYNLFILSKFSQECRWNRPRCNFVIILDRLERCEDNLLFEFIGEHCPGGLKPPEGFLGEQLCVTQTFEKRSRKRIGGNSPSGIFCLVSTYAD